MKQTIIVTGAAGFIGSNLICALNQAGYEKIIAVDNLNNPDKFKNISDLKIADFIDKNTFIKHVSSHGLAALNPLAVFHQGACSNTMEHDGTYMMQNNFDYSKTLLHASLLQKTPFIYASSAAVYGNLQGFTETFLDEKPLNIYGYSKLLFDRYMMQQKAESTVVGLRYFNVYGPREFHKNKMASVALHHFNQYKKDGFVKLFGEYGGYSAGEHVRDFVYIDDIIKVNLFFLEQIFVQNIFNVGTGKADSFNQVAHSIVNAFRRDHAESILNLHTMVDQELIQYVHFPQALEGKYQSYTQANIAKLRQAGYKEDFIPVTQGCQMYYQWLKQHQDYWA